MGFGSSVAVVVRTMGVIVSMVMAVVVMATAVFVVVGMIMMLAGVVVVIAVMIMIFLVTFMAGHHFLLKLSCGPLNTASPITINKFACNTNFFDLNFKKVLDSTKIPPDNNYELQVRE